MTPEYINSHAPIYNYLIRYFLPDLSDPHFRQDAAHEIEQDERMTYCRYMAAWLPHEPYYKEILRNLKSLSIERSTRQQASASSYLLSILSCDDFSLTVIDAENSTTVLPSRWIVFQYVNKEEACKTLFVHASL